MRIAALAVIALIACVSNASVGNRVRTVADAPSGKKLTIYASSTFEVEPRSDEMVRAWFDGFGERGRHRLFVAREDRHVLGYASSSTYRPRAAYAPSVETSVYLDERTTGRGIGGRWGST